MQGRFSLEPGSFLCSPSGAFLFGLSGDGDLGIWAGTSKIWSAHTQPQGSRAVLQLDGNFVVRDSRDKTLWQSKTNGPEEGGGGLVSVTEEGTVEIENPSAGKSLTLVAPIGKPQDCPKELVPGDMLAPGSFICSPDNGHAFGVSLSGDLGVWQGSRQIWSGQTCCDFDGVTAYLQYDGNLVVRARRNILWSSTTPGKRGAVAHTVVGNDGVVVILNQSARKRLTISPNAVDGSIVVRDVLPQQSNYQCKNGSGHLVLHLGEFVCSDDGHFKFGLDYDGGTKFFASDKLVWSVDTCCSEDDVTMVLQRSDGNLVVRDSSRQLLWAANSAGPDNANSFLGVSASGVVSITNDKGKRTWGIAPIPSHTACLAQVLGAIRIEEGQFICSEDAKYRFGVVNGDLSLWRLHELKWSGGTCCAPDGIFASLREGRLSLLNSNNEVLWTVDTQSEFASLVLGNDGVAKLVDSDGQVLSAFSDVEPEDTILRSSPPSLRPSSRPSHASPKPSRWPSLVPSASPSSFPSQFPTTTSPTHHPSLVPSPGPSVVPSPAPSPVPSMKRSLSPSRSPTPDPSATPSLAPSGSPSFAPSGSETAMPTPMPFFSLGFPDFLAPRLEFTCVEASSGRTTLLAGEFICSPNQNFRLGLATYGEFVFVDGVDTVWEAGVCCGRARSVVLQRDGNLVVYSSDQALWASNTAGLMTDSPSIMVGDDGVATVYSPIQGHIWSTGAEGHRVSNFELHNKVVTGYQGWFFAEGDGGIDRWQHWSQPQTEPNKDTITIDMWPDLSELGPDELFPTDFRFRDGSVASLYSAYNTRTVERHLRWMRDYGIDGPLAQRFIRTAQRQRHVVDRVLSNVRSGAEKFGRVFAVMYDISNGSADTVVQAIVEDWKHLVDDLHVTESRSYLRHRGRPLLAIWGFGVHDRIADPPHANALLDWFQFEAEEKYRVTLMGGVPAGWRDLTRDSKTHMDWMSVYRRFDVLSPWTVGRMVDNRSADFFRENYIEPDMEECVADGIDYLPVVFPGFSARNLLGKPINEIPRNGGSFFWRQLYNAVDAGNRMLYIAMFDEVDEATAIFKVVARSEELPTEGELIALDADLAYGSLPNDWYLRLAGRAARYLDDGLGLPQTIPLDV